MTPEQHHQLAKYSVYYGVFLTAFTMLLASMFFVLGNPGASIGYSISAIGCAGATRWLWVNGVRAKPNSA